MITTKNPKNNLSVSVGDASFYKSSFHKNIISQMFISQKIYKLLVIDKLIN